MSTRARRHLLYEENSEDDGLQDEIDEHAEIRSGDYWAGE